MIDAQAWVAAACGLLLGAVVAGAWLTGRVRRLRRELAASVDTTQKLELELARQGERLALLQGEREREGRELQALRAACQEAEACKGQLQAIEREKARLTDELAACRERLADCEARGRAVEAQARSELKAAEEKLGLLREAENRLREQFQQLAQQVLDERARQFGEQSQKEIGNLVVPLREQLHQFREILASSRAEEARERGALAREIQNLKELNLKINEEAVQLTRALRGQAQVQGAWGEMVLERVLEASGLVKGEQYLTQESFPAADGKRLRPDVVVLLPEGKHLIIDAKVSLTAYERYANAESEAARASHLKEHLASIRRHVEQLGERDYVGIEKLGTPDFVLMFVPVEAALVEAVRHDGQLYVHALERNVALVSPSTLLATLRTVSHLWRLERRSRNAETIAEHAGRLHDHFASLIDELEEIGQRLDRAKDVQVRAMRRLTEGGKGSILLQVQRLKELGAKAGKELPAALLDRAAADEGEAPPAAD